MEPNQAEICPLATLFITIPIKKSLESTSKNCNEFNHGLIYRVIFI